MTMERMFIALVIALLINNTALYFMHSSLYAEKANRAEFVADQRIVPSEKERVNASLLQGVEEQERDDGGDDEAGEDRAELNLAEFHSTFKKFTETNDFADVMDSYFAVAQERHQELDRIYGQMDAPQLFDAYFESDIRTERRSILSKLREKGLQKLRLDQLKLLYQEEDLESWIAGSVLEEIVKRGDLEGIRRAKELLVSPDKGGAFNYSLAKSLYEHDPEFMIDHMSQLGIDEYLQGRYTYSSVMNKKEIQQVFLQNNIDELMAPDTRIDGLWVSKNLDIEMSRRQQSSLLDLFSARDSSKRELAISLARNIQDTDRLRAAYADLTKQGDQLNFVKNLYGNYKTPQQRALARSIALASEDPDIRRIVNADIGQ